jgi:hypothetical protein
MQRPSNRARLAAVIATLAAVLGVAGQATAAQRVPPGMTAQEWKALLVRSEALNRQYHLGVYADNSASAQRASRLRGEALNARYGNAWTRLSPQQFRTVIALFGPGVTQFSPKELRAYFASGKAQRTIGHEVSTTSSGGFAWGDAGIGALAAIGAVLVAAAVALARRRTSRVAALGTTATT